MEELDFLPRLAKHWEKQYEAGHFTAAAGRSTVHPKQAAITRLCAKLSPVKLEVASLMALRQPGKAAAYFAEDIKDLCTTEPKSFLAVYEEGK